MEQIKSIHQHTIHFQKFLEDCPKKVNSLEGRIRDVATEAEDIIEHFMWDTVWSNPRFINRIDSDGLDGLKKVTEEFDLMAEEIELNIKNSFRIKQEQLGDDSSSAAAGSLSRFASTHKDVMVGFDDDLMEIKSRLCGGSSNLRVVPIFGMGGIGKTTLARSAYEDPLAMEYFHIRAWVTVSQDYSAEEIISNLLNSMKESNTEISGEDNEEKVYKSLKGLSYLIVMDDMWSTNAWDDVRNIFPDDNNGSRIMLTTRLSDVAAYPSLSGPLYEMSFMNEDQSWNLLRYKVFAHQQCPIELKYIGKEIARSCRGLPLAIVVISGILSTISKNQASWAEIAENVNSVVAGKDGQFEEILSLSYTHLPHHLRPCFLYMGGFPKDHEIRVSKLIKLWVAEGFLKCGNGSKSLEEEAEECLESLVERSLVLVTKRKPNGKIKSCSLHDLMRDLCIRKSNDEKFLVNNRDWNVEEQFLNQRRLSIAYPSPPYLLRTYGPTIHTIMWFIYTLLPSFEELRLLWVLDAGDAAVLRLPSRLFELFHLRYLAINYTRIPAAISKLQNLQMLIIRARGQWKLGANYKDCLPLKIWRMPQLRHLVFYGRLPNPEETSSTLQTSESLQTLIFSMCDGMWAEGIFQTVPNLKKLEIKYYDQWGIDLNGLVCLHRLEILTLRTYCIAAEWWVDAFTFPSMLKKLTLSGFRLPWHWMTRVCSLPNLEVLKLRDFACRGETWEVPGEGFPKLQLLLIEESYLENWITESSHFPRLKLLLIHDCWRLCEILYDFGEIPTLELIELKGYLKTSLVESAKTIQSDQQDLGNNTIQVRCLTR